MGSLEIIEIIFQFIVAVSIPIIVAYALYLVYELFNDAQGIARSIGACTLLSVKYHIK